MARSIKSKKLDTRTARRAIVMGKATHWLPVSRGRALGYRKGLKGATWVARFDAENVRREEKLGDADDISDSDGIQILDFSQALEAANRFFLTALTKATSESPRGGPYTVADAVQDYLTSLENRDAADHQSAVYDLTRNVLPFIGEIKVNKLKRPRLEAWLTSLAARPRISTKKQKKNAKPEPPKVLTDEAIRRRRSSANRTLRRLCAALNRALKNGKVNTNPMNWKLAPFANADSARAEFLTEAQQRIFVTACGDEPAFQDLVLAGLFTGMRFGELGRLLVQDFIPSSKSVYVAKSKSGKPRHVILDDEGVTFFSRLTANRGPNESLLLRDDGSVWKKGTTKKPMRRACKKSQIPGMGFHQLRHSFATRLLTRKVIPSVVQRQLGHRDARMMDEHYGHITDVYRQEAMGELPSVGLNEAAKVKSKVVALPSRTRAKRVG
jgi:integrase